MSQGGTISRVPFESIDRAYQVGRGGWAGCDWPTAFGETSLDLNGITSHQALLMARATAGAEATDWREAVGWLRLVEVDAEVAESAARGALEHARRGDLSAAVREARAAYDLEAQYHAVPVWSRLRDVLESAGE